MVARKKKISRELRDIISLIPGYDPFREQAGYYFDEKEAYRRLEFFPDCLTFVEGEKAGQAFVLEPWQQAIVANVGGWKSIETGHRRYRMVLLYISRKNGKSPFGSAIVCQHFFLDHERGMQIYNAAGESEQASIIFRAANAMIASAPELSDLVKMYQFRIEKADDPLSFIKYVSGEPQSKHGYNPSAVFGDELHCMSEALVSVLESGRGARPQPIWYYFTTADFLRDSICNRRYKLACEVRDGIINMPSMLPVIYEAKKDVDDWEDEKTWWKCNPNLGVSKRIDEMRELYQMAKADPAEENTFKRLHLNMQTDTDVRWITKDKWDLNDADIDLAEYEGKQVSGGAIDLGNVSDLTSLCLCFAAKDGGHDYFWWNWMPKVSAEDTERKHGIPYSVWSREGWVKLTEGNEIDYNNIETEIVAVVKRFGVKRLAIDRAFQGAQLAQRLNMIHGIEMIQFGQGWASYTAPMHELMRRLGAGMARHGGNPVAQHASANITSVLPEGKTIGTQKAMCPGKTARYLKIDPLVTMIMSTGESMLEKPYIDHGELYIGRLTR